MPATMGESNHPAVEEVRARVRAAMAYAVLSWPEVATAFGVSESTIRRKLDQTGRSGDGYRRELAHLCGVPEWFILEGFAPPHVPPRGLRALEGMRALDEDGDEEERPRPGA